MRTLALMLSIALAACSSKGSSGARSSSQAPGAGGDSGAVPEGGGGASGTSDSGDGVTFVRSGLQRTNDLAPDSGALTNAVEDDSAFALDLYRALSKGSGNLFLSPFSITTAMAMAWAGAKGRTATEIASVLHYGEPTLTHAALGSLDAALGVQGAALTMTFTNALWLGRATHPLAPYLDTLATAYGAGVGIVDFGDPAGAARAIDAWVSEQTRGTIPALLVPTDLPVPSTVAVLTNAAYFKARWETEFDVTATVDDHFLRSDGTSTPVKMMRSLDTIRYATGSGYQAAALPYSALEGHHFEMVVVLPEGDLGSLEPSVDGPWLAAALGAMHPTLVDLALPRFEFRSSLKLKNTLSAMGMPTAFDPSAADFTGIVSSPPLHILDVIHQGFVSVNETGTEASAATAVIVGKDGGIALYPTPPVVLRLDHPFLVLIRHVETGTLVFVGRVAEP